MLELHPKLAQSVTTVLRRSQAEPETCQKRETKSIPCLKNSAYPDWGSVALWIFVFFTFGAFVLCMYLIYVKCHLAWFWPSRQGFRACLLAALTAGAGSRQGGRSELEIESKRVQAVGDDLHDDSAHRWNP